MTRKRSAGGKTKGDPLHEKEIFEVTDCEIILENGQLFLLTEIDLLSHD